MTRLDWLLVAAALVGWGLAAFEGVLLWLLLRRHGRTLLALEELRAQVQSPVSTSGEPVSPLGVGSPVPELSLPDLSGKTRRLAEFRGKPALLLFFSPSCGYCLQLAPRLGNLGSAAPSVVMISRGSRTINRRLAKENRWDGVVLLDSDWKATIACGSTATPTAYLVDAEGRIASPLAVGGEAVLALVGGAGGSAADSPAASLREKQSAVVARARAAGLAIRESTLNRNGLGPGTRAPEFSLPDLAGQQRSLTDWRGRRILLVFSDPDCGPCQALAPELEVLHRRRGANRLEVVMVSRGGVEANREKAKELGLSFAILLQRGWAVSKDYALFGTPVAYLLDEKGLVAAPPAQGASAVRDLALGRRLVRRP